MTSVADPDFVFTASANLKSIQFDKRPIEAIKEVLSVQ